MSGSRSSQLDRRPWSSTITTANGTTKPRASSESAVLQGRAMEWEG